VADVTEAREYFLGVDAGTTSVKAALFDARGSMSAHSVQEYALVTPREGWAELPAGTFVRCARAAVAEVRTSAGVRPDEIVALACSSQGQAFILLDENDKPLRPWIVWLDRRAEAETEEIVERLTNEAYHHRVGLPRVSSIGSLAKLMWLRNHEPDVIAKASKLLLPAGYLAYRLTGRAASDPSNGGSTLMYDRSANAYWADAVALSGLDESALPEILAPGTLLGTVLGSAADEWGLSPRTVVAVGPNDQLAGCLGAGNVHPGDVSETTGTALAVAATADNYEQALHHGLAWGRHCVAGRYFYMTFAPVSGMALRWFRDSFAPEADYDEFMKWAEQTPAGAQGLSACLHFQGSIDPDFNPRARGAFSGMTLAHTPKHFVRSIVEAVCFSLREQVEALAEAGIGPQTIRSTGGAARSDFWLQLKSDVLGIALERLECEETACLGDAMLGMLASGSVASLEEAVERCVRAAGRFEPTDKDREALNEAYGRYRELYDRLWGRR